MNKNLTLTEVLKKELAEIEEKLKGDFINPKDMRRKDEITSLLLTDCKSSNLRFAIKKGSDSQRVTSFTRNRK